MNCEAIENEFSKEERLEIIFLLERIAWKVLVTDVLSRLLNNEEKMIISGSLESTQAGRKIENDNIFDPDSPLSKNKYRIYMYPWNENLLKR